MILISYYGDRFGLIALRFKRVVLLCCLLCCGCRHSSVSIVAPASPASPAASAWNGIQFENVTRTANVDYVWPRQPRPMRNLEAFGSGCAFLDYDNDGWQDILLVAKPYCHLYRNLHNGHFADVTQSSGLARVQGYWTGCAVGDYDGDGRLDILLTGYHCLALLHNEGNDKSNRDANSGGSKGFVDATVRAGLDSGNHGQWGSSAGFMDLAGNGRLDLVILNYVVFGPKEPQVCSPAPGIQTGCPPTTYRPEYGEIWENRGGGRFQNATQTSGIRQTHGKALVVAFCDPDEHGRMDFYIGNDGTPAEMMRNLGGLRFRNIGVESGTAYGSLDHAIAAMGADWGDYDRDGRPDLIVTAFSDEAFGLFHNTGQATFEEANDAVGLSVPTFKPLGFGAKWLDMDNDGWPDLVFTTGHVYDAVNRTDPTSTLRQPLLLFRNENGRAFKPLVSTPDSELAKPLLGRGLAVGDFDNDGRMDFLAVDFEGAPVLMRNVSATPNHWITLDLRAGGQNRFAYGAQLHATGGRQIWTGQVSPASSYLSSSDPRIHWGLGAVETLDTLDIRWPDGHRETLRNVAADRILTVTEGQGIAPGTVKNAHNAQSADIRR